MLYKECLQESGRLVFMSIKGYLQCCTKWEIKSLSRAPSLPVLNTRALLINNYQWPTRFIIIIITIIVIISVPEETNILIILADCGRCRLSSASPPLLCTIQYKTGRTRLVLGNHLHAYSSFTATISIPTYTSHAYYINYQYYHYYY